MGAIRLLSFAGMQPKVAPRLLTSTMATEAVNCVVERGMLEPLPAPFRVTTVSGKTVYRYKSRWLSFPAAVDVAKSPTANSNDRIYWTGDGYPKATNWDIWPATKRLGVPNPTIAPNVEFVANPNYTAPAEKVTEANFDADRYLADYPDVAAAISSGSIGSAWEHYVNYGSNEGRVAHAAGDGVPDEESIEILFSTAYVYTAVNDWGEESGPSPPSAVIDVRASQYPKVINMVRPAAPGVTITKFRVYRSVVGSSAAAYQFVAEVDAGLSFYQDEKQDADLGSAIQTSFYAPPPDDLQGLLLTSNGLLFGFKGNEIYPSETFVPYAYPVPYMVSCESNVVGLAAFGTTVVACTETRPYTLTGVQPGSPTLTQLAYDQPCLSKASIVATEDRAIYASPDGLFAVGADGSGALLTKGLFTKKQWRERNPKNLIGAYYGGAYLGFEQGTGKGFVLDLTRGDIVDFDLPGMAVVDAFHSASDAALYLLTADGGVHAWAEGDDLPYSWESKEFFSTEPICFFCARASGGEGTTFTLIGDGEERYTGTLGTGDAVFRLPSGYLAQRWRLRLSGGTDPVMDVALATSTSELAAANGAS